MSHDGWFLRHPCDNDVICKICDTFRPCDCDYAMDKLVAVKRLITDNNALLFSWLPKDVLNMITLQLHYYSWYK